MIKIIDNFLEKEIENKIKEKLNADSFPWFYYEDIIHPRSRNNLIDERITKSFALVHTLFTEPHGENSNYFLFFLTILNRFCTYEKINLDKILRIRIRRTFFVKGHSKKKYNTPHVDLELIENYKSLVYYVEDSDGDTVFFKNKYNKDNKIVLDKEAIEDKRISPKQGRAIYFNGDIFHSGNCPVNYEKRTIINFDFKIK